MARLRAIVVWLLAIALFAFAPLARAADPPEPAAKTPRDVPVVVQPSAITIPPLPATDQVRDLGWISIAYPPSAHERVEPLLHDADELKAQLADELGQPVLARRIDVRVARSPEDMASLAPVEVGPPQYASAVAYPALRLVILSMRAPYTNEGTDLDELLRHELAHIALDDAVDGHHVPAWFNEGYAIHASSEVAFERIGTLTKATLFKNLIPLADLDRSMPDERDATDVAYAESADFVRFILRQSDRQRFSSMIDRARKGATFDRALGDAYGTNLRKLEYEWHEELAQRYSFWPVLLSGSSVWVLTVGALAIGMVRRRRRTKAIYARWEKEEALEAARSAVLAQAASEAPGATPAAGADPASMRPSAPSVPKIEHDGGWHTVH